MGITKRINKSQYGLPILGMLALIVFVMPLAMTSTVARADNFTDIFYTNSFRGAFTWVEKLDWLGMVVQVVISVFSLLGVVLLTIRIMTSMLYLSAKGMWEEVHDLKSVGGESELYDFGLLNMAKGWAHGKAGTGLDAIIGAILILLPDVKKYSDFGEKAGGQKFDEDTTISQYMLKIALPTVMTVFFFAMGFNGTLFQALAVTVDFMGSVADKAVSVNYAGFVDDLANSNLGYKFTYNAVGTELGSFQQDLAKDLYGRAVSSVRDANAAQLQSIGQKVKEQVDTVNTDTLKDCKRLSAKLKEGLGGENADRYVGLLGYDIIINSSDSDENADMNIAMSDLVTGGDDSGVIAAAGATAQHIHVYFKQTRDYSDSYFNVNGG